MRSIDSSEDIENLIASAAVLVLFGGPDCGVCKAIYPQLESLLNNHFPRMQGVYIDCAASPEICAQHRVFSLPVVKVYIEGMLIAEEFGSFSLSQLKDSLSRPYSLWLD